MTADPVETLKAEVKYRRARLARARAARRRNPSDPVLARRVADAEADVAMWLRCLARAQSQGIGLLSRTPPLPRKENTRLFTSKERARTPFTRSG